MNACKPYAYRILNASEWKCGQPLTLDGCLIMLCLKGSARFSISSRIFAVRPYRLAFITFDRVTVPLEVSDDFKVACLRIGFNETQDIFFLVTSNRFWEFVLSSPVFTIPYALRDIVANWFCMLEWIQNNCDQAIAHKTFHNETENFMHIMADRIERRLGQLGLNPAKNRAWILANDL